MLGLKDVRRTPYVSVASFSVVLGLLLCLGTIILYNFPAPGRFPDHGDSTHARSGMTARCLLLAYPGQAAPRWYPYAVELRLQPGPHRRGESVVYQATGWAPDRRVQAGDRWPSAGPEPRRYEWAYAGRDSIDIAWHHSPLLRLPIAGVVGVGRGGYEQHYSLADAWFEEEFVVRSTGIPCAELPR